MRSNGGLIGKTVNTSLSSTSGIFDIQEQGLKQRDSIWPVSYPFTYLVDSYTSILNTVTIPTSVQAGDLLIYGAYYGSQPSGFSTLAVLGSYGYFYYKIADGTEGGVTYTTGSWNNILLVFRTVNATPTLSTSFVTDGPLASSVSQSITGTGTYSLVLSLIGHSVGTNNPCEFTTASPAFDEVVLSPTNTTFGSKCAIGYLYTKNFTSSSVTKSDGGNNNILALGFLEL
jgi:hypothetical protein